MSLDLGELVATIKADATQLLTGVSQGNKALDEFSSTAKAASDDTVKVMSSGFSDLEVLMGRLPKTAKGAVDRSSVAFQALSPELKKAVQDAEAQVSFDKLPAEVKSAITQAEAAVTGGMGAIGNEAEQGGDRAGGRFSSAMTDKVKKFAAGAGVLGAGIGAGLAAGVADNLNIDTGRRKLQAQLGLSAGDARTAGEVAGKVYGDNFGASLDDANEAIAAVVRNTNVGINSVDLQPVTEKVLALRDTFDVDLGESTAAIGQMIRTGMVKDAQEGLDVLTVGLQGPANKAGDLMDTMNEYGTQFRTLGLDGQSALGLITQGLQGGARDADVVGDSLKEFAAQVLDTGSNAGKGFRLLGLDANQMREDISKGGPASAKALDMTLDRLRAVQDPALRSKIALDLFAGKAEDMGQALFKLDPSTAAAAGGLEKVHGAADRMTKTTGGGAQAKIEGYRRHLVQMGRDAIASTGPTAMLAGAVAAFGPAVIGIAAPVAQLLAARALQATAAGTAAGAETAAGAATSRSWLVAGGSAVVGAVKIAGAWALSAGSAVASAVASTAVAVGTMVGGWALMGLSALRGAAQVALSWIIALGPIALVIAAVAGIVLFIVTHWDQIKQFTAAAWDWVVGKVKGAADWLWGMFQRWTIVGIVISHWDQIKNWTVAKWNAIVDWVKGVPGAIVGFFQRWTLVGVVLSHWDQIKSGIINKAGDVVNWVRGLPGRIVGALGNMGRLLFDAGHDAVVGMWNGMQSMGKWLYDTVWNWVKSVIPGPVKKALGIASPSKVMAELGAWVGPGLAAGIDAGGSSVDASVARLAGRVSQLRVDPSTMLGGLSPSDMYSRPGTGGGNVRYGDTWTISGAEDPETTARHVSAVQSLAGVG